MNLSTAIRSVVKAGWEGIKNMRVYIIQAGQEQPLKRQGRHRERGGDCEMIK